MNENDLQPPNRPCCLQELVIQLAQGCKLIYLERFMYHYRVKPDFEDLSDSDSDEDEDECAARGREMCRLLRKLDHALVAAHAFASVPSLRFVGLSLHSSYYDDEYWAVDPKSRQNGLDDDITTRQICRTQAALRGAEAGLNPLRFRTRCEDWEYYGI